LQQKIIRDLTQMEWEVNSVLWSKRTQVILGCSLLKNNRQPHSPPTIFPCECADNFHNPPSYATDNDDVIEITS